MLLAPHCCTHLLGVGICCGADPKKLSLHVLARRWDQLLSTVSSGLVRLLRHPLMAGLCEIAAELDCLDAQDYKVYSVTLLQVGGQQWP